MSKTVFRNILMNVVLMMIFVWLNNLTLNKGLEETFISLALVYGVLVVLTNALFIKKFIGK